MNPNKTTDESLQSMVFITGFARGGTSWLRDCVGHHPDVAVLPRERTVFRDVENYDEIPKILEPEISELLVDKKLVVNKAPANAPYLYDAARKFPKAKFIFIIRDPRDVLTSHQRGNKAWMKGRNSEVEGCMTKLKSYYEGFFKAQHLKNVLLVRYEDVHQSFPSTMERIFDFLELEIDYKTLNTIFEKINFQAQTNRSNKEDRNSAKRKGVIGDWGVQLTEKDKRWFKTDKYFADFFQTHDYSYDEITYENILYAMAQAQCHFLNENDLLTQQLNDNKVNIVLQHDIDYLNKDFCFDSVLKTAEIEKKFAVSAQYNFLPLDDSRYSKKGIQSTIKLMEDITRINNKAFIGLHVNACERFYSPAEPNDPSGKYLNEIINYVHQQVFDYENEGVKFKISTSHGYARGKKVPNNRDTPEISEALREHQIALFDTDIRPILKQKSAFSCAITDVGGILKPRRLGPSPSLIDPNTYLNMPKNTFLRFLTHPGNYHVESPSVVAMRNF